MESPSEDVRKTFKRWRSPIRGNANPENQANLFWQWCIQSRTSAYEINKTFGGPDSTDAGPCWCFSRMGQPSVSLPDGREVLIAGEHEDHYDPDFYIYNDVVVMDGERCDIFGYLTDAFPPTDFHTATLVEEDIILIGNLGYQEDRDPATIQVFRLSTQDWSMSRVETSGAIPGWLHGHSAHYVPAENAIVVSGGKRYTANDRIVESIDDYRLSLADHTWFQLTDRRWDRWVLEREDGEPNHLWEIRTSSMNERIGLSMQHHLAEALPDDMQYLIEEMTPKSEPWQIEAVERLYVSPLTGEQAHGDEEEYGRYRLDIDGVTVRFDEGMDEIAMTVEGCLPESITRSLVGELKEKLSSIEQTPYKVSRVDPS